MNFINHNDNDTVNEPSIHNNITKITTVNNSTFLKNNDHNKNLENKRIALVSDNLNSPLDNEEINSKNFTLHPDNWKQLDVVIENNTARKKFMEICKESDKFIESEEFNASPEFHYFKHWIQSNVLPLPTINKINKEILMLVGYKLNPGICKALRFGLEKYNKIISKIVLENNGMSDAMLSELLEIFILKAKHVTSLWVSKNDFGAKTSQKLSEFIDKAYNLKDLKIDNWKILGTAMDDFIENLKENWSLKKLILSHCGINNFSAKGIWKILAENVNLQELDLSWNNILPKTLNEIMDELDANKTLRYLNLSWNQIKGSNKEINKQIIAKLSNFIKENRSLLHIELWSMNLQGQDLKKISKVLSMSSSLLGIHLSGNPMNEKQIKYLRKCLRIKKVTKDLKVNKYTTRGQYGNADLPDVNIRKLKISKQISNFINGLKTKYVKRDMKLKEKSSCSSSLLTNKYNNKKYVFFIFKGSVPI